ncbi:MAG: hypothetical protein R3E58_17175 [Phycisphaerae bacterium]
MCSEHDADALIEMPAHREFLSPVASACMSQTMIFTSLGILARPVGWFEWAVGLWLHVETPKYKEKTATFVPFSVS